MKLKLTNQFNLEQRLANTASRGTLEPVILTRQSVTNLSALT